MSLPDVPVIPVYINCATPPLGRPGRAFALGRAVGEELSYLDQRVLFVGSGGLSHSPPSLVSTAAGLSDAERLAMNEAGRAAAMDKINPAWDEAFLRRIADAPASLEQLTSHDIAPAGVGANEVRTWIAAIAAGNLPMETVVYRAGPGVDHRDGDRREPLTGGFSAFHRYRIEGDNDGVGDVRDAGGQGRGHHRRGGRDRPGDCAVPGGRRGPGRGVGHRRRRAGRARSRRSGRFRGRRRVRGMRHLVRAGASSR